MGSLGAGVCGCDGKFVGIGMGGGALFPTKTFFSYLGSGLEMWPRLYKHILKCGCGKEMPYSWE